MYVFQKQQQLELDQQIDAALIFVVVGPFFDL